MSFKAELPRKGVHITMGAFALALRWLTPMQAVICAAVALLFNAFIVHRVTKGALLREGEREKNFSWGILFYPGAVFFTLIWFFDRLELAAATWGLLAIGDGFATLIGKGIGGPRLPWNRQKTWSGFMGFVVTGFIATAGLIVWTQWDYLAGRSLDSIAPALGPSFVIADGLAMHVPWWLTACLVTSLLVAWIETLAVGVDDNLLVPSFGAMFFTLFAAFSFERWEVMQPEIIRGFWYGGIANLILAIGAYVTRGVTVSGALIGALLGTTLWAFGGPGMFAVFAVFFILGTVTTKLGYAKKARLGIAQEKGGRRGPKNAIANMGAGILFSIAACITPMQIPFLLAAIAAFATAAADTVASEIGQAYGRNHMLVTTFRKVPAGTDGAVSFEGTLAGILASVVMALVALMFGLPGPWWIIVVAAFVGTTAESYLGVLLEAKGAIDNEFINFANTVIGGLVAYGLALWVV